MAVCLSDGQLAGIIFGCIFGTLIIAGAIAAALLLWRKKRQAGQKGLPSAIRGESEAKPADAEVGRFVYDNPDFREDDDRQRKNKGVRTSDTSDRSSDRSSDLQQQAGPLPHFKGVQLTPQGRYRSVYTTESLNSLDEFVVVPLKSQDFTGLGFSVIGNLKEGIYVKEVYGRGPAAESGKIHAGDRLIGVTVSFRQMAFEDALTILSYASPYDVNLELQKATSPHKTTRKLSRIVETHRDSSRQIQFHPLVKSQSMEKLSGGQQQVELDSRRSRSMATPGDMADLGVKGKVDSPATTSKSRLKFKGESPQLSIGRQEQPQVYRKVDPDELVLRTSGSLDKVSPPVETVQTEVVIEAPPVAAQFSFEEITTEVTFEKATEKRQAEKSVDIQSSAKVALTTAVLKCQVDDKLVEWNSSRRMSQPDEFVNVDITDPYGHLSDEDKIQVLRLSYEDSGLYEFDSYIPVEIPPLRPIEELSSTPIPTVVPLEPQQSEIQISLVPAEESSSAEESAEPTTSGDTDSLEGEEFDFSGTLKRLKGSNQLLDYDPDNPPTTEPPSPPSLNIEQLIYDQPLPDNLVELAEIKVETVTPVEVPSVPVETAKEIKGASGPDSGIEFEPWETSLVEKTAETTPIDQMRLERERMFISGHPVWDKARETEERDNYVGSNEDLYTLSTTEVREVTVEKFVPELKLGRKEVKPGDPEYIRLRHPDLTGPARSDDDFSKLYLERKAKLKEAVDKSNWLRQYSDTEGPPEVEIPPMELYSTRAAISLSPGSTVSRDSGESHPVSLTNGIVRARKVVIDTSLDSADVANNNSTGVNFGKRDSGYGTLGPAEKALEARLDQQHYQKLLYFQQQLAKQHEELAQLGIEIPPPPMSLMPKSLPPPIPEAESSV